MWKFLIFVVVLIPVLLGSTLTVGSFAQETLAPEQVVNKLLTAPHGLTWASGSEIADLLAKIQQNPAPYIPYLLQELRIEKLAAAPDELAVRRSEIAAMALVQAGGTIGRDKLVSRLNELYGYSDQLQATLNARISMSGAESALSPAAKKEVIALRTRFDRFMSIERTIINSFANIRDSRLKNLILERLDDKDVSNQLVYILYFQQTGSIMDSEVRKWLESLLQDPRSHFYGSPFIREILGYPEKVKD